MDWKKLFGGKSNSDENSGDSKAGSDKSKDQNYGSSGRRDPSGGGADTGGSGGTTGGSGASGGGGPQDPVVALYEAAEQAHKEGKLEEAEHKYKEAFDLVREGAPSADKSRRGIFGNKLARLYIKLDKYEHALEFLDFLDEKTRTDALRTARERGILPEDDAGPAARKLIQLTERCDKIEIIGEIERGAAPRTSFSLAYKASPEINGIPISRLDSGKPRSIVWRYEAVGVDQRPGGVEHIWSIMPSQESRKDGLTFESFINNLPAVLKVIKASAKQGALLLGTVETRTGSQSDGMQPGDQSDMDTEAQQIAIEVLCELFEVNVPPKAELKLLQEAVCRKKMEQSEQALSELRGGPAGVTKWKARRNEERSSFDNLRNQDLSKTDLSEVQFYKNDLSGTNFDCSELRNSLFEDCNLSNSSFANVTARCATFRECLANNANFSGASVTLAKFIDVSLLNGNFESADLRNCKFIATYDSEELVLHNASFCSAKLRDCEFNGVFLKGVNFDQADLSFSKFIDCKRDDQTRFPQGFNFEKILLVDGAFNSSVAEESADDAVEKIEAVVEQIRDCIDRIGFTPFQGNKDVAVFGFDTDQSIEQTEATYGFRFPSDYRYFLKELGSFFLGGWEVLYLGMASGEYESMQKFWPTNQSVAVKGPIKRVFKNKLWWPMAFCSHEFLFIDMDPAPGGQRGQIIYGMDNNNERVLIAESFSDWLSRLVQLLELCEQEGVDQDDVEDFLDEHFHDVMLSVAVSAGK